MNLSYLTELFLARETVINVTSKIKICTSCRYMLLEIMLLMGYYNKFYTARGQGHDYLL